MVDRTYTPAEQWFSFGLLLVVSRVIGVIYWQMSSDAQAGLLEIVTAAVNPTLL